MSLFLPFRNVTAVGVGRRAGAETDISNWDGTDICTLRLQFTHEKQKAERNAGSGNREVSPGAERSDYCASRCALSRMRVWTRRYLSSKAGRTGTNGFVRITG